MQIALDEKRLDATFIFCLILTLCIPALYPFIKLSFFAPFLIITLYKKNLSTCLWIAFLCGLILDLFSSYSRLGIHALCFCFSLSILYPQRRNFFADSLTTLPIMTFLFASISSGCMAVLLYCLEMKNLFSWHWIFTDGIIMPLIDAIYAFCCFVLPALLFGKPRRRGKDYFIS